MTHQEINKIAARVQPAGSKLKHFKAALPDLDETTVVAVRQRHREITELRLARAAVRSTDPILVASRTRYLRKPSVVAAARERQEAAIRNVADRREREVSAIALKKAVRETLLAAAREARKLGFDVRASHDRRGRVSSYYCSRGLSGPQIRISDHAIPATAARDEVAASRGHGFYSGYNGPEIVITKPRRAEWLKRAIVLATAGRLIP